MMGGVKIALVHELLTMRGGAERVLRVLARMFPDAPMYTLLYNERKLGDWFPRERIRTSALQKMGERLSFNHHLYLKKFPAAVEAWDFSEFDVVLSTSSAFVHGIITNSAPLHLSYIHSPARYLWDRTHDVLARAGRGPIGFLKKRHLERAFHNLRIWDAEAADRPDKLLSASKEVQRRIELYWRRESDVLHPPVSDRWFEKNVSSVAGVHEPRLRDFYLVVSTLVPYKRIEIAIEAANKLKCDLVIVGEGPDANRLKRLGGPTVQFLGFQNEEKLRELYHDARAVLFPGEEDFGLVPLEAMACGTPVIAYRSGGALETIVESATGEFFDEPSAASLLDAIERLALKSYDALLLREHARHFSESVFTKKLGSHIAKLMDSTHTAHP